VITDTNDFPSINTAGVYAASKKLSARNCTTGEAWHYSYSNATNLGNGVWQLLGTSQYDGTQSVLANAVAICPVALALMRT